MVIAGHSSGGQIVQRHALFTRLSPNDDDGGGAGTRTAAAAHAVEGGRNATHVASVRHVVANPSSFAYLDGRRWINGVLRNLTAAERSKCPLFNSWQVRGGEVDANERKRRR